MTTQELAYSEIERLVKSFKEMLAVWLEEDLDCARALDKSIERCMRKLTGRCMSFTR
jgi:hypothetical protein